MPKHDETEDFPWKAVIVTGPGHDLTINGKELKGLEQFILKLAEEHKMNWWELANTLLYLGVGQVAAADYHAGDSEAIARYAVGFSNLYTLHIKALTEGYNELAPAKKDMN
jgi:hypothetical protein